MIVSSMTVQEIREELLQDVENIRGSIKKHKRDFEKSALKVSPYPFTKSYECRSKLKKNLFIVTFTAKKRGDFKKPAYGISGIYTRPEGNYAAALTMQLNMISIYPPHFFKRYRERIVKDQTISNEDLIRLYFKNDWGFMGAFVSKEMEAVFYCYEDDFKEEAISFVSASSQGYCFGEKQGQVNIIKTIISDEMLFENQKSLFADLKRRLEESNKQMYGWS